MGSWRRSFSCCGPGGGASAVGELVEELQLLDSFLAEHFIAGPEVNLFRQRSIEKFYVYVQLLEQVLKYTLANTTKADMALTHGRPNTKYASKLQDPFFQNQEYIEKFSSLFLFSKEEKRKILKPKKNRECIENIFSQIVLLRVEK